MHSLKLCPFCAPNEVINGVHLETHDVHGMQTAFRFVECMDCGATGPRRATKREALSAWSTRNQSEQEN